jgi:hypothetical protein
VAQKKLNINDGRIFPRSKAPPTTIITCRNQHTSLISHVYGSTHRAGAEKQLIKTKHNFRKHCRTWGRRYKNIPHPKVSERANEWTAVPGVSKTITPKHPLKRRSMHAQYQQSSAASRCKERTLQGSSRTGKAEPRQISCELNHYKADRSQAR